VLVGVRREGGGSDQWAQALRRSHRDRQVDRFFPKTTFSYRALLAGRDREVNCPKGLVLSHPEVRPPNGLKSRFGFSREGEGTLGVKILHDGGGVRGKTVSAELTNWVELAGFCSRGENAHFPVAVGGATAERM